MNIEENFLMKATNLLLMIAITLSLVSCGFFKDYSKGEKWSYFEEWDANADAKVDKNEFIEGCLKDDFIQKNDTGAADSLFTKADEDQNGILTGLEFYRWKVRMVPEDDSYNSFM
jgi:hypothetical protein